MLSTRHHFTYTDRLTVNRRKKIHQPNEKHKNKINYSNIR